MTQNPVDSLFTRLKSEGRGAFVAFLAAGDPDLGFTARAMRQLQDSGADLIELGVPFSDPIADGPVIQAAYNRALNAGFRMAAFFETARAVTGSPGWVTPVMAMASYSLVYRYGPERFIADSLAAGISGVIVPDLPIEEAGPVAALCRERGFALTLLVTPTTSPERAVQIAYACTGFVYVVSVVGITGEQARPFAGVPEMVARLRTVTDRPLCVGFGVSRPEQVRELAPVADGVIVGTALVRAIDGAADPEGALSRLGDLTGRLRAALN